MKAIFALSLLLLSATGLSAQTTFFVSPLLNYKVYFCSMQGDVWFGQYSEHNPNHLQNPYYTFGAKRVSVRPALNVGVRAGASFQGGKHLLFVDWMTDQTGTMSKESHFATANLYGYDETVGPPLPSYNIYGNGINYFETGFVYNRVSLQYGRRLTKPEKASAMHLLFDASMTFGIPNRMDWYYENDSNNTSVYYHNEAKCVNAKFIGEYTGQRSLMLGLGLKSDIAFNLNGRRLYLFSLEATFRQGMKFIAHSAHAVVIRDSGELVGFTNGLVSKGSGLYFQVSRNFQLYPWIGKRARE